MSTSYSNSSNSVKTESAVATELKDSIKALIKAQFEHSVKEVCKEDMCGKLPSLADNFSETLVRSIAHEVYNSARDKKLGILYNHEKHLLDILKEYKEEIKFAESLQAEIRKEAASFFTSTLKDVYTSLKEAQVAPEYQVQWIFDLVSSYTSSLKLSSRLAEDHVINLIGEIQKESADTVNKE